MGDERFLVSFIKGTIYLRKFLKIKTLLKEGCDLDESVREEKPSVSEERLLVENPLVSEIFVDMMKLSQKNRQISCPHCRLHSQKNIQTKKISVLS